jgi:hypothetical protein
LLKQYQEAAGVGDVQQSSKDLHPSQATVARKGVEPIPNLSTRGQSARDFSDRIGG